MQGPRAIRYPRGGEQQGIGAALAAQVRSTITSTLRRAQRSFWSAMPDEVEDVLNAAKLLGAENIPCDVYKLVKIFPFTEELHPRDHAV